MRPAETRLTPRSALGSPRPLPSSAARSCPGNAKSPTSP
nr:MAG TPA: hypothetical protein [Caudoviricetes sp.]